MIMESEIILPQILSDCRAGGKAPLAPQCSHGLDSVNGWCKLDVQLHDEAGMRTCKWFRLVWAEFKQSFMTVFHQPLYHNMFTAARCVIASWTSILFCFFCHGHLLCRVLLNHPETVLYVAVDHQEQDGYKWDQTGSADLNQSETVLCISMNTEVQHQFKWIRANLMPRPSHPSVCCL